MKSKFCLLKNWKLNPTRSEKKNLFILSWMRVAMRFEKIINQNNAETKIKKKDFWYQKSINLWGRIKRTRRIKSAGKFLKSRFFFTSSSSPSCLKLFLFQFFFSPTIFPYTSFFFFFILLFLPFELCTSSKTSQHQIRKNEHNKVDMMWGAIKEGRKRKSCTWFLQMTSCCALCLASSLSS